MKKELVLSVSLVLLCGYAQGQKFLQKIQKKVEDNVNQRVDNRENRAIDKGLDKAEQHADNAASGQSSKPAAKNSAAAGTATTTTATAAAPQGTTAGTPALKAYNNYDFVPGDRIVFEDHFTDGQDGEFPPHWNLNAGQGVVNKVGDYEALLITAGNSAHVSPLIKGATYLADTFSIEFDSYSAPGGYGPHLYFYSSTADAASANNDLGKVNICSGNIWEGVDVSNHSGSLSLTAQYASAIQGANYSNKWHHVAIAYKHNQLKVYVDQYRVLVVPSLGFSPKAIDIGGIGLEETPIVLANVRIANGGGMNTIGKKFTEAKIVTHGINFDVNKATIKPESMGTLNGIVQLMKDNPDVKFEIGGHTDSDGGDAINMPLSQQRADAVRVQLSSMGVQADRLTAKGYGATKPISKNDSMEGKANNRRVEFVKK